MLTTIRPRLAVILVIFVAGLAVPGRGERVKLDYVSEGLTRDTLEVAARPQPAPATDPKAEIRFHKAPYRSKSRAALRREQRHNLAAQRRAVPTTVVSKPNRPRRKGVVRFVYWWNGWVIRTFHTKFGTVLLHTIGAEQTKA